MKRLALVLAVLALVLPRPAHAYLDPTSGSMLLQILLGGFAGLAVGGKLLWHKLAGRFARRRGEQQS
jgi:hypothetical protein